MIEYLERRLYKQEGGNKYHIDCNKIKREPNQIDISNVIRYKNDVSILNGVINHLTNNSNIKRNRHIVAKIGFSNKKLEKEFSIGNLLANISGYINYICLFDCYDDSYDKPNPTKICSAEKKDSNMKKVLLMPYINDGSIKTFKWSLEKFDILRSVVIQSIISAIVAYQKIGFIHGDFHLDNILLKKTKKTRIEYELETDKGLKTIKIPTNGYRIVIMDFENSWIFKNRKDGLELFWSNLYNMVSRLNWDLEDESKNKVDFLKLSEIISYIENNKRYKTSIDNAIKIITMINQTAIKLIRTPSITSLTYNHNVF